MDNYVLSDSIRYQYFESVLVNVTDDADLVYAICLDALIRWDKDNESINILDNLLRVNGTISPEKLNGISLALTEYQYINYIPEKIFIRICKFIEQRIVDDYKGENYEWINTFLNLMTGLYPLRVYHLMIDLIENQIRLIPERYSGKVVEIVREIVRKNMFNDQLINECELHRKRIEESLKSNETAKEKQRMPEYIINAKNEIISILVLGLSVSVIPKKQEEIIISESELEEEVEKPDVHEIEVQDPQKSETTAPEKSTGANRINYVPIVVLIAIPIISLVAVLVWKFTELSQIAEIIIFRTMIIFPLISALFTIYNLMEIRSYAIEKRLTHTVTYKIIYVIASVQLALFIAITCYAFWGTEKSHGYYWPLFIGNIVIIGPVFAVINSLKSNRE